MMYHIIYMSSEARTISREELLELLETSRIWNASQGITGALFYRDGNFLQVIEGEEAPVRQLFTSICNDRRHRGISALFQEEISHRDFAKWSMAFHDLDLGNGHAPKGFSDLLNRRNPTAEMEDYTPKVRAFLKAFAR